MTLVSSSIAFFIQYIIFSLGSFKTGYLHNLTPDWSLTGKLYYTFKALILYIISDPIITIILPGLFVLSFYLRKKITLGKDGLRVGIEASSGLGWEKYLGENGLFFGMKSFGASAPAKDLYKHFGIDKDNIIKNIKDKI